MFANYREILICRTCRKYKVEGNVERLLGPILFSSTVFKYFNGSQLLQFIKYSNMYLENIISSNKLLKAGSARSYFFI